MVCGNLCERLSSKIIVGKSHYEGGKNTVAGVRFSYFIMARFVRAVEWHQELHPHLEEAKKI
jgi:hypothetical protein